MNQNQNVEDLKKQILNKPEGVFKYLEPAEIDAWMKARKEEHKNKKGYVNQPWQEDELLIRRQVIIDYIAQGLSRRRLIEQLCDRWEIGLKTAYTYYNDAIKFLAKDNEKFREYNRDKMQERLEYIMTEAIDRGCYKEAVMAAAELDKILGLQQENKKIEITDFKTEFKFGE